MIQVIDSQRIRISMLIHRFSKIVIVLVIDMMMMIHC
jgi:hypothetical protein